jgi:hypothetical protein
MKIGILFASRFNFLKKHIFMFSVINAKFSECKDASAALAIGPTPSKVLFGRS